MAINGVRSRAQVLGVGSTGCGVMPGEDAICLGAIALEHALQDAGLDAGSVDALITVRIPQYERLAQAVGISPAFAAALPGEGRMAAVALQVGASLIASGAARTVAIVYGNDGRSAGTVYGGQAKSPAGPDAFWLAQGMTSPGAAHAMMFAQHAARHGTPHEALQTVATTFRAHAALNPLAAIREPMDADAYFASPWIAEPLRRADYCYIADGGMAVVLSSADHPPARHRPAVYLRSVATQSALLFADRPPSDLWHAPMQHAAAASFAAAGLAHEDIDALMVYDNFTPTVLLALEGFGYCAQGTSGDWVRQGHLGLEGRYPANPSGGHLSEGYMQGWALIVDAVRQIRGDAPGAQLRDCHNVHYMCASPICGSVIFSDTP